MSTERRPQEERREEIVEAIIDLVGEQGERALSVSAVARRIGLVPSAIYRHFRDREAMVDGVVDSLASRLMHNAGLAESAAETATDRLRSLLDRHLALVRRNPGLLRLVFSSQLFGGAPHRRAVLHRMIQGYLGAVARIILSGQENGEFRRDVDPQAAALYFLGLIQPLAVLWHLTDGGVDVTRMAERNWQFFLRSISSEGGDA